MTNVVILIIVIIATESSGWWGVAVIPCLFIDLVLRRWNINDAIQRYDSNKAAVDRVKKRSKDRLSALLDDNYRDKICR